MDDPRALPIGEIEPWPGLNARKRHDPVAQKELEASIKKRGLIQPVGVTLREEGKHWLYAGERRFNACVALGLKEIPVFVRQLTEEEAVELNLMENVQRDNLTPMEEAHGLARSMELSGKTQVEMAKVMGKTQGWVSNRIRLLRMPLSLQELFDEGAFTHSLARDFILPFAPLPDPLWDVLTDSVAKSLARKFKKVKRGLVEEEIRERVSKVAVSMSAWLDGWLWDEDNTELFESYIRIPEKEWKKAPKGTVIQYPYGERQMSDKKTSRVFDQDWWQEAMGVAKAVRAQEDEARKQEFDGELEEGGKDLEWTPELGPIPEDTEVPYGKRHIVYRPVQKEGVDWDLRDSLNSGTVREGNLFCDPSIIPKENLVIQDGWGGPPRGQPVILCTKADVFEAAVESLAESQRTLEERRLQRQVNDDIEQSKAVKLSQAIPTLLSFAYSEGDGDFFNEACEDLELKPTFSEWFEQERVWNHSTDYAIAHQNYLLSRKKKEVDGLAKLLVYRMTRSPSGEELDVRRHIRRAVAGDLRATLLDDLRELIELPTWKEEVKPEPKEEEDATEGA